jgi:hypothetical protein
MRNSSASRTSSAHTVPVPRASSASANWPLEQPRTPSTVQRREPTQAQAPTPPAPTRPTTAPPTRTIPITRVPTPSYVDLPVTRHRLAFSYLGSPTALVIVSLALLVLITSTLPLATVHKYSCFLGICNEVATVSVTVVSLVETLPLVGIITTGAVVMMFVPAISLLARSYGRIVTSLGYLLLDAPPANVACSSERSLHEKVGCFSTIEHFT